jgi:hypothetical protein
MFQCAKTSKAACLNEATSNPQLQVETQGMVMKVNAPLVQWQ